MWYNIHCFRIDMTINHTVERWQCLTSWYTILSYIGWAHKCVRELHLKALLISFSWLCKECPERVSPVGWRYSSLSIHQILEILDVSSKQWLVSSGICSFKILYECPEATIDNTGCRPITESFSKVNSLQEWENDIV